MSDDLTRKVSVYYSFDREALRTIQPDTVEADEEAQALVDHAVRAIAGRARGLLWAAIEAEREDPVVK